MYSARAKLTWRLKENNDWFDINAVVYFGSYKIPFIQLRNHILNRIKEFTLPSGEIAIIPEQWFSQYGSLLHFTEGTSQLKLRRHHIGLVNDLAEGEMAQVTMNRKLQKLTNFDELEDVDMPPKLYRPFTALSKSGLQLVSFFKGLSLWRLPCR